MSSLLAFRSQMIYLATHVNEIPRAWHSSPSASFPTECFVIEVMMRRIFLTVKPYILFTAGPLRSFVGLAGSVLMLRITFAQGD